MMLHRLTGKYDFDFLVNSIFIKTSISILATLRYLLIKFTAKLIFAQSSLCGNDNFNLNPKTSLKCSKKANKKLILKSWLKVYLKSQV